MCPRRSWTTPKTWTTRFLMRSAVTLTLERLCGRAAFLLSSLTPTTAQRMLIGSLWNQTLNKTPLSPTLWAVTLWWCGSPRERVEHKHLSMH